MRRWDLWSGRWGMERCGSRNEVQEVKEVKEAKKVHH
jgi:hypothetical protein